MSLDKSPGGVLLGNRAIHPVFIGFNTLSINNPATMSSLLTLNNHTYIHTVMTVSRWKTEQRNPPAS